MSHAPVLADSYRGRKIVIYEQGLLGSAPPREPFFTGQVSGLDEVFEGSNRYQLLSLIRAHLDGLDGLCAAPALGTP